MSPSQAVASVISGTVVETVNGISRPLADSNLGLYVDQTEGLPAPLTRRVTLHHVMTDGTGQYRLELEVPTNRVFVTVWGRLQPCIDSTTVDGSTTLDVEVFPPGSPGIPASNQGPLVTAFVYETTPEGRKPLRGAGVELDIGQGAYVASNETNDAGVFAFCRVNTRVRMDVWANGYEPYMHSEFVDGNGDRHFEFEFRR